MQAAVPVRRRNRDGFPIRFQPPASALRHALRRHKPIRPAEFAVKVNLHHPPLLLLKQDEGKRPPRRLDLGIILNHRARIFPIDGLRPLVVQPEAAVVGQRASRRQQKCRQYDSPSFHVLPPFRAKNAAFPSVYKTREPRRLFQFFPNFFTCRYTARPRCVRKRSARPEGVSCSRSPACAGRPCGCANPRES